MLAQMVDTPFKEKEELETALSSRFTPFDLSLG
jgi:hypothetical protein